MVDTSGVLALDAVTSLVAVALLLALPKLHPEPATEGQAPRTLVGETLDGLRYLRGQPVAAAYTLSLFVAVLFAATDYVAFPFLSLDVFGAGERGVGLLFAAAGLGLFAGSIAFARLGGLASPAAWVLWGLLVEGVTLIMAGFAPAFGVALAMIVIGGIGNGLENGGGDTLLHRTVPRVLRGRVFGTVYGAAFLADALASGLGGGLVDLVGARWTLVVGGGGALLGAGIFVALLRRDRGT